MRTFVLEQVATFDERTGCWNWNGKLHNKGYGNLWWCGGMDKAHRVSWMVYRGPIPPGMSVLHECDNRICVNPSHLFLGTHQDNMDDMVAKGRSATRGNGRHGSVTHPEAVARGSRHGSKIHPESVARGSRAGAAKLDEETVKYVREFLAMGCFTQAQIAAKIGVQQPLISRIKNGHLWAHV